MANREKKFKLADAVGAMQVDLRVPGNDQGTFGSIPEPSQQQVNAWKVGLSKLAAEYGYSGDPNDTEELAEFMANLETEDLDAQEERTAELYAELCSDVPDTEELMRIKPRYRQAFYGYVAAKFQGEGQAPGGES